MRRRLSGTALAGLLAVSSSAAAATYYVSPTGSDANSCAQTTPCRQIRRALTLVGPGDTILVADGSYLGFDVKDLLGVAGSPITIKAQGTGAQVVPTTDRPDNRDTIFITYSSYIVIDGLRSFNATRGAVRVDESPRVTIRNSVFGNNTKWGIFTDFSDDLLIEGNECYGSEQEHGIYVSNSGDRPVVRGNRVHDNIASGIQLNADASMGGDGLITGAVIEDNVIYNNGANGGGAINLDGVQDSIVRNNLLYNNRGTGIVNYQGDGAAGPKGMEILNNTVDQAATGRYAMLIWSAAGPNKVRNNILYHPSTSRGSINYLTATDILNTDSDYNVITRITPNDGGTLYTLAEWQAQGHELHSITAAPAALFVNSVAADYHLAAASPAIDRGQALPNVLDDIEGHARPVGAAWDLGAYEGAAAGGPQMSIADVSVGESAGSAVFTVSLSAASATAVTVNYATANGTALAGQDYQATSGSLSFSPGVTSRTITVPVLGDTVVEPTETFSVALSGAVGATIADGTGLGTILDDDGAATPTLSISDVSVLESNTWGGAKAVFTVSLSAAATQAVTVKYATADGTAIAGQDYQASSGGLYFNPGDTAKPVTVWIIGNTVVEPNETFSVVLSQAVGAAIADGTGQGTILNDDGAATPSLSIADLSVGESAGSAVFTVSLSAASAAAVTVNYATANGTALAGQDYQAASGSLSFSPGVTTKTITVAVLGDTVVEPTETFSVALSGAVGATIADGTGLGTILDDDGAATPTFSISDVSVLESNTWGGAQAVFTVSLSAAATQAVTVKYATADGTAIAGQDYLASSGGFYFNPGGHSEDRISHDHREYRGRAERDVLRGPESGRRGRDRGWDRPGDDPQRRRRGDPELEHRRPQCRRVRRLGGLHGVALGGFRHGRDGELRDGERDGPGGPGLPGHVGEPQLQPGRHHQDDHGRGAGRHRGRADGDLLGGAQRSRGRDDRGRHRAGDDPRRRRRGDADLLDFGRERPGVEHLGWGAGGVHGVALGRSDAGGDGQVRDGGRHRDRGSGLPWPPRGGSTSTRGTQRRPYQSRSSGIPWSSRTRRSPWS